MTWAMKESYTHHVIIDNSGFSLVSRGAILAFLETDSIFATQYIALPPLKR